MQVVSSLELAEVSGDYGENSLLLIYTLDIPCSSLLPILMSPARRRRGYAPELDRLALGHTYLLNISASHLEILRTTYLVHPHSLYKFTKCLFSLGK